MNEIVNELAQLPQIEQQQRPTVTDQVFSELYRQVLSLELPPGTKMSEVDVAKAMGVSRQPVRDAFYRLSKMGVLADPPAARDHGLADLAARSGAGAVYPLGLGKGNRARGGGTALG